MINGAGTSEENQGAAGAAATGDVADLSRLRLAKDFAAAIGVKKALLTVPVRKPTRQEFVRVHPDPAFRTQIALIELRDEGEVYAVEQGLCAELPGEVIPKVLLTTITKQGVVLLWPIRLPGEDGRLDAWNRSALDAADLATKKWVKVVSDRALGAYNVFEATGNLSDPEWPEVSFEELVRVAFKGRVISTLDHPVLRRLRGEV